MPATLVVCLSLHAAAAQSSSPFRSDAIAASNPAAPAPDTRPASRDAGAMRVESLKKSHASAAAELKPLTTILSVIRLDERVTLFPTIGYRLDDKTWEAVIHGWIYEDYRRGGYMSPVRDALGMESKHFSDEENGQFNERMGAFLADNESGKRIWIRLAGRDHLLDPSGANGHFHGRIRLKADEVEKFGRRVSSFERVLELQALTAPGDKRVFAGGVHLLEDAGLSVVSDIDDTIKITQIADKRAVVLNTFLRDYEAIDGMCDAYCAWIADEPAAFHYVSASPWQLYAPLSKFLYEAGFPAGTFEMKTFRWKDSSVKNLFTPSDEYKRTLIEPLLKRFPNRKFVLVGDASERDAELYAGLARDYPSQVVLILIRDPSDKRDHTRYAAAFEGLARSLWRVFSNASEIRDAIPVAPAASQPRP